MSAFILAGDIASVRIWCTDAEQASVNTFHYLCSSITSGGCSVDDMALEFDLLVAPLVKVVINNNAVYNGVQVYVNHLPLPNPGVGTASSGAGTGGANANSRQTAGLTRWNTAFAGQANRGRTYWPFPSSQEDAIGGVPSTVYLVDIDALANAILSAATFGPGAGTSTMALVIKHGKNKLGITPPPTQILAQTAIAKWATQKRRGSYGRSNVSPI